MLAKVIIVAEVNLKDVLSKYYKFFPFNFLETSVSWLLQDKN